MTSEPPHEVIEGRLQKGVCGCQLTEIRGQVCVRMCVCLCLLVCTQAIFALNTRGVCVCVWTANV